MGRAAQGTRRPDSQRAGEAAKGHRRGSMGGVLDAHAGGPASIRTARTVLERLRCQHRGTRNQRGPSAPRGSGQAQDRAWPSGPSLGPGTDRPPRRPAAWQEEVLRRRAGRRRPHLHQRVRPAHAPRGLDRPLAEALQGHRGRPGRPHPARRPALHRHLHAQRWQSRTTSSPRGMATTRWSCGGPTRTSTARRCAPPAQRCHSAALRLIRSPRLPGGAVARSSPGPGMHRRSHALRRQTGAICPCLTGRSGGLEALWRRRSPGIVVTS